ncbi:MAG TPA: RNA polymerase sigma factor [Bryobacteraceae bacterium]|jgi:RNA polymerase sigma-70 factor (ECF subfamily)
MSDVPDSVSLDQFVSIDLGANRSEGLDQTENEVVAFFSEFRGRLLRYLFCLGLSVQDGEEVVQEVFLLLFQHLQEKRSRQNLRGWLFRVAHNLGLKKRTESWRETGENREPFLLAPDADPSPEEQVIMKQQQKHLLAVLGALPAQDRSCLYLRAEGLRYREIAEVLGISLGSVSQALARAVKRLNHVYQR